MIEPKQIETALGYAMHHSFSSDYKTVSTALNSGVPLALTNHSEISAAVRQLHPADHQPGRAGREGRPEKKRAVFSFSFLS